MVKLLESAHVSDYRHHVLVLDHIEPDTLLATDFNLGPTRVKAALLV